MSRHEDDDTREIHTRAGTSDGIVGNGEKMTGKAGPEVQEEASRGYEAMGAIMQGKDIEDFHEPTLEEDEL